MRIDAKTGQLSSQIITAPQNHEVIEFIPVGQHGVILAVQANSFVFFSHV